MVYKTITPKELYDLHQEGIKLNLIDVRTPLEFNEIHATLARNIPLDLLDPHIVMKEEAKTKDEFVYMICQGGDRSSKACEKFLKEGYKNVASVEGGTLAWEESKLPICRGKKTLSLERQVRIAAGLLVLTGAIFGYFVHPYFIAISAFVGAGLTFAGITNTCGMGMMLAKMPWNQIKE